MYVMSRVWQLTKVVPWIKSLLSHDTYYEVASYHIFETNQTIITNTSNPAGMYLIENTYEKEYSEYEYYKRYNRSDTFIQALIENPAAISLITEEQFRSMNVISEQMHFMSNWGVQNSWLRFTHGIIADLKEAIFGNPVLIDFIREHLPRVLSYINTGTAHGRLVMGRIERDLSENPASIDILEANPQYIKWDSIQENENAIPIILRYISKNRPNYDRILLNLSINTLLKHPIAKHIITKMVRTDKGLFICTQNKAAVRFLEKTKLPVDIKLLKYAHSQPDEYVQTCTAISY